MPSQNSLAKLATLRSRALFEDYCRSRQLVAALTEGQPVIPPANSDQEILESEFFTRLHELHVPYTGSSFGAIEITRILPQSDMLTLWVKPQGISSLLTGVLPHWDPGDTQVANGIPGLRCRILNHGRVVEYFHLQSAGIIRFIGIPAEEFAREQRELESHGAGVSMFSQNRLTPQELDAHYPLYKSPSLASLLMRRFGILRTVTTSNIDCWWNRRNRLSVELITPGTPPEKRQRLLQRLTSPALAPRLELRETPDLHAYHTYLHVKGSDMSIDLRFLERK